MCMVGGTVVMFDKRKVLKRLHQKVWGQAPGRKRHRSQLRHPRRRDQTFPQGGTQTERGKPVVLPEGKASRQVSPWGCGDTQMEKAKAILS
jgi:hypothetical protein